MKNKSISKKISPVDISKGLTRQSIYLALLSGLLLFLSFPKYGIGFIAWIAFVPFFIALKNVASMKQALILGSITGIIGNIGIVYWITYVIVHYGHLPFYLGIILMLLLAFYLSIYVILYAGGIFYFKDKIALYLTAPVLWVCLEYLKSYLFTGFPWENLGYSQYLNIFFIQIADITGVFGLSFLIILLNVTIFEIIQKRSKKVFTLAAVVVLIWGCVYGYGVFRIKQIDQEIRQSPGMEVSLIQGNIDQSIKWNDNYQKETLIIHEELSLRNPPTGGGLIVWPETAVPFNFQDVNDLHRQIKALTLKTKSWFIFGSMSYEGKGDLTDYYNSAYLLSPDGEIRAKYDKVHLVPYGEYVPLRDLFPFIKGLTAGIGDFTSGNGFRSLMMDNRKIGVLICYEGILSEAARAYKNESVQLLVNITNDAWFGTTSAPFQHLSMTVFRSVETRLYLVRAANTGVSAIIDPAGKIIAQTGLFEKNTLRGMIKFIHVPTIYAQYGDVIVWVCFILVILYVFWTLTGRLRNVTRKHSGSN